MVAKLTALADLSGRLEFLRKTGKRIAFTNGCFDILHAGHARYLAEARGLGDALVVGLNSDVSVRRIKDENRPITPEEQRAEVLAGLWCVDFITIFDEPDPERVIRTLKPDVLVKGADWAESDIIGGDFVKANGGKVARIAVVPDISTTRIIRRIVDRYGRN